MWITLISAFLSPGVFYITLYYSIQSYSRNEYRLWAEWPKYLLGIHGCYLMNLCTWNLLWREGVQKGWSEKAAWWGIAECCRSAWKACSWQHEPCLPCSSSSLLYTLSMEYVLSGAAVFFKLFHTRLIVWSVANGTISPMWKDFFCCCWQ